MIGQAEKQSEKIGFPPDSAVHIGEQREDKVRISVIDYNEPQHKEEIDKGND